MDGLPTAMRCGEPLPARIAFHPSRPANASSRAATRVAVASGSAISRSVPPPTPITSARTSNRREVRSGWTDHPMASPMSLGVRPTFTPSNYVAATTADPPSGEVLSTGVYLSGNAGLEVGACYAISRDGDRLRVFGPVDAGQLTVRHEGPVDEFDVTAMDDRVILTGRGGRSSVAFVFGPSAACVPRTWSWPSAGSPGPLRDIARGGSPATAAAAVAGVHRVRSPSGSSWSWPRPRWRPARRQADRPRRQESMDRPSPASPSSRPHRRQRPW